MEDHISRMESALQQVMDVTAQGQQDLIRLCQELANVQTGAIPSPPAPAATETPVPLPREPSVGVPERYDGDPTTCNAFLCNCTILFSLQPLTFASEEARVAYAVNHLSGRARLWGTAEWQRGTSACRSFRSFAEELRRVFGTGSLGSEAGRELLALSQGRRSVSEYAIDFRTRAPMCDWNPAALRDVFLQGLAGYIKDELVAYDPPSSLEALIELATRLDLRIQARRRERRSEVPPRSPVRSWFPATPAFLPQTPTASLRMGNPEPMQLGRTHLTPEEKERRRRQNLCLYCGQSGHFADHCPEKAK